MKCPECIETDQQSNVYPGSTTVTLMGYQTYYDEDGVYHHHDPNRHTTGYSCSNGHQWQKSVAPQCPAGDYPEES